jgi:DnaJ-class molecular chaperone
VQGGAFGHLGCKLVHFGRIRICTKKVVLQECQECPNVKLVENTVELHFEIEPGMLNGEILTLYEEGEPHPDGDPGDLHIQLICENHPSFVRDGDDLKVGVNIDLVDALTGFSSQFEHVDGHKVRWHDFAISTTIVVVTSRLQCILYV